MEQLTDLPNIGPKLAENLSRVGVDNLGRLRKLGAEDMLLRVRAPIASAARLHQLGALAGAESGAEHMVLGTVRRMLCFA